MSIMKTQKLSKNEKGFAAMVVALTLVLVLALLTIGFAQLARREQQNALNKQLAGQANYAAETGIHDAIKYITAGGPLPPDAATTCHPPGSPTLIGGTSTTTGLNVPQIKQTVNANNDVSYTCLLIDTAPTRLVFSGVGDRAANSVSFSNQSGASITGLTFEWGSATGRTTFRTGTSFAQYGTGASDWKSPAVLQVSITPLSATTTRANLVSRTFTAFLYPSSGASGTVGYNVVAAGQGPTVSGGCTITRGQYPCQATINGLSSPGPFLVHFLNIYDQTNVRIGATDTTANVVHMVGGQAVIDATGKAQDVLKRIQVHVPLKAFPDQCNAAICGTNICKRQETGPTDINRAGTDFDVIGSTAHARSGDPCYLSD